MVIRAGVVGHPVAHSLSPRIHNGWFAELGIEGRYEAVDAAPGAFAATIRRLAAEGWSGVNVTVPHKPAAYDLAHETTRGAQRVGAANLLLFRDGRIIGDNTDGVGFAHALPALPDRDPLRSVVLGAGGAAAPVAAELVRHGLVSIVNRTAARAEDLARRLGPGLTAASWDELPAILAHTDVLVNTTSLGMTGQPPLDIDLSPMPPGGVVVDIVYAPVKTDLLAQAAARGLKPAGGLSMLVHQAAPSFEAFAGQPPRDPGHTLRMLEAERG